jgi:hypothetical protein
MEKCEFCMLNYTDDNGYICTSDKLYPTSCMPSFYFNPVLDFVMFKVTSYLYLSLLVIPVYNIVVGLRNIFEHRYHLLQTHAIMENNFIGSVYSAIKSCKTTEFTFIQCILLVMGLLRGVLFFIDPWGDRNIIKGTPRAVAFRAFSILMIVCFAQLPCKKSS